jgi:hypothetical protein
MIFEGNNTRHLSSQSSSAQLVYAVCLQAIQRAMALNGRVRVPSSAGLKETRLHICGLRFSRLVAAGTRSAKFKRLRVAVLI